MAEKVHQEKVQQEKLKAVKVRLNFEEASRHFESGTPSRRRNLKEWLGPRRTRSMSGSLEPRHGHSGSPREKDPERRTGGSHDTVDAETWKVATKVLILEKQKSLPRNIATRETTREERKQCQKVKEVQEGTGSQS
ncbi:hypothetical protein Tco_1544250 [Tanacetum coccineum]